ncbi:flagellar protein FlgN [Paenibacillus sp. MZ04-78.2]|uniref:flagellar protein FlgN n=1 Tax=Paenibacillus sp. MZ04-78.2 TaxID=2962034 RepID=UPI0020B75FF0|nr:flagellar protein FlgN [Paenibacillus sp. MZ04-78.2]MCP3776257.1 flagellar protein FlgN [Paenibacillus sp. MZ04-78.2]
MSFEAVLQTMSELNDVHLTLLELAEQKKHALIHNQVEQLTQIVTKENKLLKRIGELDQQRVEAIGNFLIEKGYKPNPRVTVSDLTKIIFNVEEKRILVDSQKQLLATIRKLREYNELNQQMIEQSLAFINYSIDIMSGSDGDELIYSNPHQTTSGSSRKGLFDAKA